VSADIFITPGNLFILVIMLLSLFDHHRLTNARDIEQVSPFSADCS
jgi:hypothetical protein